MFRFRMRIDFVILKGKFVRQNIMKQCIENSDEKIILNRNLYTRQTINQVLVQNRDTQIFKFRKLSPTHPFSETLGKQKNQETRDSIQGREEGNPQDDGERNSKDNSNVPSAKGKENRLEQVRRLKRLFHEKIELIEHLMCLNTLIYTNGSLKLNQ